MKALLLIPMFLSDSLTTRVDSVDSALVLKQQLEEEKVQLKRVNSKLDTLLTELKRNPKAMRRKIKNGRKK